MMLLAVLSGFILALFAPLICRVAGDRCGWVFALLPATLFVWFAGLLPEVMANGAQVVRYPWFPAMEINLDFLIDGLSLMFALLISGIGTFILIYAGGYLKGHPYLGRFYVVMLSFMASMLGLVLSDNLVTLFVFWELTSITSYLLIGFEHEDVKARASALQGLFVTVAGGLALMAGLIMLGTVAGSYSLSGVLASDADLIGHEWAVPMLLCILAGAFTKSAQVPFHFWLPNAMAAPTPVSAFLHSATMVKAGVYLLARLNPALGEAELWTLLLSLFGGLTMFTGAFMAITHTGAKKVLAYSTIMALGTLVMLIGIGTHYALVAFATFLVAHSLYKGALFMIAGILDHETGTKDVAEMGGLAPLMPVTAVAAAVAALSLAGLPPLLGFVGKELMFEAVLEAPAWRMLLPVLAFGAGIGVMVAAGIIAIKPFYGKRLETPKHPHEAPVSMLAGPVVLAGLSLLFGVALFIPEQTLVAPVVASLGGTAEKVHLALWHGINMPLILSLGCLVVAGVILRFWSRLQPQLDVLREGLGRFGPEAGYFRIMEWLTRIATWQTRVLQNGTMGNYMITLALTTVGITGFTLITQYGVPLRLPVPDSGFAAGIALLMIVSAFFATGTVSRLGSVAAMSIVGFAVALIFILFSAPDLGITQILVETLTVILLVLVLFRLPGFTRMSSPLERWRDIIVAVLVGSLMTVLILAATEVQFFEPISAEHVARSVPDGHGRNIVNVILVDFRALDTLGEIFVLALAAVGVYSMIRLKAEDQTA
ncbi:Na(+)/H(+) antiporter subunit A [Halovibrio salipaludis]|uniref:Na(+)/H(+) antiporter subunit A n=2 Tax=Halovibrio salipaludis TaxID=2032626 RepID=A0A2A2EXL3_9GAMM|nr:Na(+)/H(+) antiporter subunit A [Halovibrio salipaludis]